MSLGAIIFVAVLFAAAAIIVTIALSDRKHGY